MVRNWLEKVFEWCEDYRWAIPTFISGVGTGVVLMTVFNVSAAGNSLITSLVGTLIGALFAFLLTLRAQKRRLKAEIENTARLEITAAINQYLLWSASLGSFVMSFRGVPRTIMRTGVLLNWSETLKELEKARRVIDDPSAWALRLQEYGNVFPYAREGRREMVRHYRSVSEALARLENRLLFLSENFDNHPPGEDSDEYFNALEEILDLFTMEVDDFLTIRGKHHHLMIDLLFALQNRSLGRLFGNEEPPPERPGRTGPYLIEGRDGTFQVVDYID